MLCVGLPLPRRGALPFPDSSIVQRFNLPAARVPLVMFILMALSDSVGRSLQIETRRSPLAASPAVAFVQAAKVNPTTPTPPPIPPIHQTIYQL